MQTILQSGFLQNLANALLNSFWQMGVLWLIVFFVLRIFTLNSAQKFNLAFVAQLLGFIIFMYGLINHFSAYNTSVSNQSIYINNVSEFTQSIMPVLGAAYVVLLMWKVIKMFFEYRSTQKLRTDDIRKASAINRIFVKEMSSLFSIKRKVAIYFSGNINCPLTFGFLKPIILLPIAIVNNLTKEQTEAVILHELAHIKRADYLLYLVQCFIDKIFFFNIFSKMLGNIIERERENACDDWVIQFKYNTYHYAEALLKLGKLQTASLVMAASGKTENVLLPRIKRLLHDEEKTFSYSRSFFTFNALTLFFALMLMIFSAFNPQKTTAIKPVFVEADKSVNVEGINRPLSAFQYFNTVKAEPVSYNTGNEATAKTENNPEIKPAAKKSLKSCTESKEEAEYVQSTPVVEHLPYVVNVRQLVDSIRLARTTVTAAVNAKIELDSDALQHAVSYQNFKQLETMLAVAGNSIKVSEDKRYQNDYKKLITIETTDKYGNKHIYKVVVELYQ